MKYKNIEINWLGHSGFMIKGESGRVIYIDPFKINSDLPSADVIFITHSHYDHCSIEDINKIAKHETIIVCTPDSQSKMRYIDNKIHIITIEPNSRRDLLDGLKVWTIPAYNLSKPQHTREEDWVGYIIQFEGNVIYHAGDTDLIPEMKKLAEVDIALLPVGGGPTMNAGEAAKVAVAIKPKLAIPMHWGSVFGEKSDAEVFLKHCSAEGIEAKILEVGK